MKLSEREMRFEEAKKREEFEEECAKDEIVKRMKESETIRAENSRFRAALEYYDSMFSGHFCTHRGPSGSTFEGSRETHTFDIGQVAREALNKGRRK